MNDKDMIKFCPNCGEQDIYHMEEFTNSYFGCRSCEEMFHITYEGYGLKEEA